MADKKISELPLINTISGSIVYVPIVHDGITEKITVENFSKFTNKYAAQTGSVNIFTANQTITANLSVGGTSTLTGNTSIGGNLVVNGKLTAQELFTEITSASIIFESGSTIFGNSADDTHQFTGIVSINGTTIGAQALNDFTASTNNQLQRVYQTTSSLNIQTGSQDLVNLRISSTTGSINTTTSSFDSVFLRISSTTGSINTTTSSFDSVFLRISSTTGSINTTTSSFDSVFLRISSTTGSINTTTSSFDSVFLRISSTTGSINTTTSSFDSEFVKIGLTTSSIHFTTQSLNTQTGSQGNLNAQIGIATGSLNAFTGSVIGQTNTISTFTGSVNFTTQSLNTQTGSQNSINFNISVVTSSINAHILKQATQTGSQDLINYQNSIITSSFRIELNSIEAYTSSLKSAITVNGSNVQIIGELNVNKLNVQYISSSVLLTSGSNVFGDAVTDKHEFTGSVNIKDTLFVNGQAIGLSELNSFTGSTNTHILKQATQTGSQDLVNYNISIVTSSIDKHILNIATQTGSQQNLNVQIGIATASLNTYTGSNDSVVARILQTTASLNLTTGSLIGITNGLMDLTASMKGQAIVSSSTQVQNYDVFALNSNLYNSTGSIKGEIAGIEAYTASLKGAAIVSSSQQITNYYKFAETASANTTFYGSVTANGDVTISNGNLVMGTAGKGIDFSANSNAAGMTSEILNDYEEGTWTPTISFGGNAVGLTYNTQYGVYTKIGNVVHFSFRLILSAKGGSTGGATMAGLPFTSANTNGNFGAVPVAFADAVSSFDKTLTWIVDPNATTIALRYCNGTNYADLNDTNFTNSSNIIASGTYRTA